MLGEREMLNGKVLCFSIRSLFVFLFFVTLMDIYLPSSILSLQAGKYVWLSYQEVYDLVLKVGTAARLCGVAKVSFLCLFLFINFS